MADKQHGMMFVLSSPSGAGKTTLTKKIAKNIMIISITHNKKFEKIADHVFLCTKEKIIKKK